MKILLLCLNAFETMEFSPFVDVFGWAHDDFDCDITVSYTHLDVYKRQGSDRAGGSGK